MGMNGQQINCFTDLRNNLLGNFAVCYCTIIIEYLTDLPLRSVSHDNYHACISSLKVSHGVTSPSTISFSACIRSSLRSSSV